MTQYTVLVIDHGSKDFTGYLACFGKQTPKRVDEKIKPNPQSSQPHPNLV